MPIPSTTETTTDGALGSIAATPDNTLLAIGASSLGTVATLVALTQVQDVRAALGYGPLAEFVANVLSRGKGKVNVLACPVTSTPGALGAVAKVGTGTQTILDSASVPNDRYDVVIKIILGGAVATFTFQYSLDGGRTYNGKNILSAATYAIPNTGITVAMAVALLAVAGDTYSFTAPAPTFIVSDLNTALTAGLNDQRSWGLGAVVGTPADAPTAASVAAAVDVKMQAAVAQKKWAASFIEGPDAVADATILTQFASVISAGGKVTIFADFAPLVSALSGRTEKRPAMWVAVARIASTSVEEHPGRFASGPLSGVLALKSVSSDLIQWSYRDEFLTPGLDDGRIATLRTWPGNGTATYITRGKTLAPLLSDFAQIQAVRVMNKAEQLGYASIIQFANESLRVATATGFLDERDAVRIEQTVTAALRNGLGKSVSDATCQVVRGINFLATNTVQYRVRVIPVGYAEFLNGEYGFFNPALVPS